MQICLLILCLSTILFGQNSGLWITRFALLDTNEMSKAKVFILNDSITDVFIQVRGRGDAFYKSTVEKNIKGDYSEQTLRDFLHFCKENNVRTHAWINVFLLVSTYDQLAQEPNHILHKKPNWIDHFNGYIPIQVEIVDADDLKANGQVEGLFAAPIFADLQTYYINLVHELAADYHFDGIHLDYFRFAGKAAGYHPKIRRAFTKKTGLYIENDTANSATLQRWQVFRSQLITKFLSELKHKSDPLLWSVAVKPDAIQAKYDYGQDWQLWLDQKLVDFVIPMNYFRSDNLFYSNLISYNKADTRIWIGLATYNNTLSNVKKRLHFLRNENYNYVIFSFNDLSEKNISTLRSK
jgi:uncharacterized lipoprotein YddW (UPF0748 family)